MRFLARVTVAKPAERSVESYDCLIQLLVVRPCPGRIAAVLGIAVEGAAALAADQLADAIRVRRSAVELNSQALSPNFSGLQSWNLADYCWWSAVAGLLRFFVVAKKSSIFALLQNLFGSFWFHVFAMIVVYRQY